MGRLSDFYYDGESHARTTDLRASHTAAKSVRGEKARKLERLVADAVWAAGDRGLTWNEAAAVTGIDKGSISPRWKPLRKQKLIMILKDHDGEEVKRERQTVFVRYEER